MQAIKENANTTIKIFFVFLNLELQLQKNYEILEFKPF